MKNKLPYAMIGTVLLALAWCLPVLGWMVSASFEIPVHVLDGAGGQSSSASYSYIGSTGQATPMGLAQSASFRYRAGYIPQLASFLAPADCWDDDGDTYDDEACGGTDCDDTDPDVNPGEVEICDNGVDDDCDGLVDFVDPDCMLTALAFTRHRINGNQYLNIYEAPVVVDGEINPLLASDIWIGNVGSDNEIAHMAGGDLDGDGYDEFICIRQKLTGVQFLTIYDPPVEVGGDINPLLASDKWIGKVGTDNQITHLTAGDMDGDDVDELIFIRERTNGNQYLNIYDAPTVVGGEINPLIASDTWIGNLGDRSEIMFMAAGDTGGDGDDELIFVRNRQNNNQYLNIYDIPTEVDGDINPLLASDLWIANLGSNNEITHIGAGDTDGDGTDELVLVRHRLNDNQYLNIYDIPTVLGGEINPIIASDLWIGNIGTSNEITHLAVIGW